MRKVDGTLKGTMTYRRAPEGSGGYVTSPINFANDGWAITGADAWGCWIRSPTGDRWIELFSEGVFPPADIGHDEVPNYPTYTEDDGTYAADLCATDSSQGFVSAIGWLYRINNASSTSRTMTRLTGGPWIMKCSSGAYTSRHWHHKLRVDPRNKNVFMCGTQSTQILYSTDGSTVNTITVAAGATVAGEPTPHLVAVDGSAAGGATGGISNKWAYTIYGTGIYQSTTGPTGTFSLLSGSPTNPDFIYYDPDGNLWATNYNESAGGNIYKKTPAGTMAKLTTLTPSQYLEYKSIAVDPQNTSLVCACQIGGTMLRSDDGGASWIGPWNANAPGVSGRGMAILPTAIKYLGQAPVAGRGKTFDAAGITFHPTSRELWATMGVGVIRSTPPTTFAVYTGPDDPTKTWFWYDDSLGIEMLLTHHILHPPGGKVMWATADRAIFKINDERNYTNTPNCPRYGELSGLTTFSLTHCHRLDYVPGSPNKIVCTATISGGPFGTMYAGISTNYGDTWTAFAAQHPAGTAPFGNIVPADDNYMVWFPGQNGRAAETFNGGTSWSYMTTTAGTGIPGMVSSGESGWGFGFFDRNHHVFSDKVSGDIYAYNYGIAASPSLGGVWKRTKSTGLWSHVTTSLIKTTGSNYPCKFEGVPGNTGHMFWKGGGNTPLYRSINDGVTWTTVTNTANVRSFAFGAAAPGQAYPSIYFAGQLSGVWAIWVSDDNCVTWRNLGEWPSGVLNRVSFIAADPDTYGRVYIGHQNCGGSIGSYTYPATMS